MIEFFDSYISPRSYEFVKSVLDSGRLSSGPQCHFFEQEISESIGVEQKYVISVNSGTSALHLAMILAGVKGKEVILPAQTFIATGLAVLMAGGIPVFCDIDPKTGNIDLHDAKALINAKTAAVVGVDWAGLPSITPEFATEMASLGISTIQDSAHAFMTAYDENYVVGSIADFTCFSFQAIKTITCGDGGAIVCKDADAAERASKLRWFGLDRASGLDRFGERACDVSEVGFKYHLNDYAAALGRANLYEAERLLSVRRQIAHRYVEFFKNVESVQLLSSDYTFHGCWLFGILFDSETRLSKFVDYMKSVEIPVSKVHTGIDKYSVFSEFSGQNLSSQREFDRKQIHLPLHAGLSSLQVEYIISKCRSFFYENRLPTPIL